ncbi:MAG: hypothetical protein PHH37_08470 [Paludibacter sp.]|nr:hypothetical protein [Paludibacter sp.]
MTKHFFPVCSIIMMCITAILGFGSFIAGIISDNYFLSGIGFGMVIITFSIYRDYKREIPRKSITISINSFNRIKDKVEGMNILFNIDGEWVEVVYAEIDSDILMNLLFKNQVKVH